MFVFQPSYSWTWNYKSRRSKDTDCVIERNEKVDINYLSNLIYLRIKCRGFSLIERDILICNYIRFNYGDEKTKNTILDSNLRFSSNSVNYCLLPVGFEAFWRMGKICSLRQKVDFKSVLYFNHLFN